MKEKVFVVTNSSCGGAERVSLLYAKILHAAGFACKLLVMRPGERDFSLESFLPADIECCVIRGNYYLTFFKLLNTIRKERPDIVFTSSLKYGHMLMIMKFLRLIRCKVILRDCNMPSTHTHSRNLKTKALYRFADVIIAQTEEMKNEMLSYYSLSSSKVTVVHNPVDKSFINEKIQDKFLFDKKFFNYVAVGRILPQKDQLTMLKAFKLVLQKQPNTRLYLIGGYKSDYKSVLDAFIQENNMAESVFFEGFQDNPFKYVVGADLFVLSSLYEGMPNVVLEAMYLGKPVAVTHSIPYLKQIIHNGKNGYSVDVKDNVALADAMLNAQKIRNLPMYNDINHSEECILNLFNGV